VRRVAGRSSGELASGTVRRVLGYLAPDRRIGVAALLCLCLQTALSLAPLYIVKSLIDHLEHPHGAFGPVIVLAGIGIGLGALGGLVSVLRTWLVLRVSTGIVARLRGQLVQKLLGQSISYYTEARGGELMSRVLNDVAVVERVLGDTALGFVGDAITLVGCIALMAVFEWRLAVVTLVLFPLVALASRRAGRPIYRTRRDVQARIAAFTAHAQEILSLSGIMLIKSFSRETTEIERSGTLIEELQISQLRAGMAARWFGAGLELVQLTAPIGLLLAGAWLVVHHYATLGTVLAFITVLAIRFGVSVAGVGTGAIALLGTLPAWERIFEILDGDTLIRDRPGARALAQPRGCVAFRDVSFRYPRQRQPALENVSLEVAPGQLIALVGPSGAGKTTLTSLLARFYDPDQGVVSIDGHDLRDLRLASIAQAVGLVLQETYLFHGTLRENLLYARPGASDDAVRSACRDAHLDNLVAELPDGLDTVVGERGHRLSGGERQRVAIARVILKDSPILILDEATSHLDTASERLVQGALARLFAGRTSFVIAHRLSTILAADVIVVLDRGRIFERGSHSELLEAGGLYASLYALQFQGPVTATAPLAAT